MCCVFFVLAQVTIKANYDFSDNHKVGEYKMKLILNCNIIDGTQDPKYIWKWSVPRTIIADLRVVK